NACSLGLSRVNSLSAIPSLPGKNRLPFSGKFFPQLPFLQPQPHPFFADRDPLFQGDGSSDFRVRFPFLLKPDRQKETFLLPRFPVAWLRQLGPSDFPSLYLHRQFPEECFILRWAGIRIMQGEQLHSLSHFQECL